MICYHCKNINGCKTFQILYDTSKDFNINHCINYEDAPTYKYKRIAEHDELMHVLYDYFTNQIADVNLSDDEIRDRITKAMWRL